MDDWELLRQYAGSRSQSAFAQLVQRHVRWVHSVCARKLRDAHLADDVTQAVFLLLSQKADRIRPETPLAGWLLRAAQLTSANAMKMERRRARREARAAEAAGESARGRQASGASRHESELLESLDLALARLRKSDRDLLLLRFYGGKTVTEAATELHISPDAAKKRFTRALESLRQQMEEQGAVVPSVGSAMAILSAVDALGSHPLPAGLSDWISAGASPARVTAKAVSIARRVALKKLLVIATASSVLLIGVASVLAWSMRPATPQPLAIRPPPTRPARAFPPTLPTTAPTLSLTHADPAFGNLDVRRLRGHAMWIPGAAFSPDGRLAVSRSLTELIRWDLAAGRAVGPPFAMISQPFAVGIGPAGRVVAIDGSRLNVFEEFGAAEPRRVQTHARAGEADWSLAVSPDSCSVALGTSQGSIRLIELDTGREIRRCLGTHSGLVTALAFSPDGKTLLSGGMDKSVRLWDVESGRELHRLDGHTSMIWEVRYSPDGRSALSFARSMSGAYGSQSADQCVRVWDLQTGKERWPLPVPSASVKAVAFTSDGARIAAMQGLDLVLWNADTGAEILRRQLIPPSAVPTVAVFSADGRQLLLGGVENSKTTLCLIDLSPILTVPATRQVP